MPGTILVAGAMFVYSTVGTHTPMWFLMIVQVAMSVGLASSFTPLFSASLGSLDRSLYSHGSAALNTLQQVAGAAGTAVLISIYSGFLHTGEAQGLSTADAGAPGTNAAFFTAACIALVPVVLAFFISKPADQEGH